MSDPVNHPAHYRAENGLEAIDVIEGFGLGFCLGNAVKYILRAGRKDPTAQDLAKAVWYLRRHVAAMEAAKNGSHPLDLKQFSLVYLATPYTTYPFGIESAFKDAAALAASLLAEGVRVYSPIAHTHPLAANSALDPMDHAIWLPFDEAMMEAADAIVIAHMPGWADSFGIAHEIKVFSKAKKPIFDIDPESFAITRRGAP
jgi:hypothetical protein